MGGFQTEQHLRHIDRFVDIATARRTIIFVGVTARALRSPASQARKSSSKPIRQPWTATNLAQSPRARGAEGTFDPSVVTNYFSSPEFVTMKPSTRRAYRPVIERWLRDENIGHRLVSQMTRDHVKQMIGKRSQTPGAANDLLKKIRLLMTFAIEAKLRTDNPASRIKKFVSGEFHTWTDQEIGHFEAHWPVGSKQRLAFAIHLFTGQRTSDVCRMSWADIDQDVIRVVQQKTGAKIWIPLHSTLLDILSKTRRGITRCSLRAKADLSRPKVWGTIWHTKSTPRGCPSSASPMAFERLRPGASLRRDARQKKSHR